MTKKDREARLTGFCIDAGDKGYLRASIGMWRENEVLRAIFPEEAWTGKEVEMDFENNWAKLNEIGIKYIIVHMMKAKIPMSDGTAKQVKMGKDIAKMLEKAGMTNIKQQDNETFRTAILWLNSLFDFFELAIQKQKEGLHPKVYISW